MATLELTRVLAPRGPAGALVLTDEEVAVLGGGKRAAVLVRVGDREARLRLGVMGGENLIGMSKATRTDLGLEVGQQVTATITVDEAPREVDVPDDLAVALAGDAAAKDAFEALPFSARKEFAVWWAGRNVPTLVRVGWRTRCACCTRGSASARRSSRRRASARGADLPTLSARRDRSGSVFGGKSDAHHRDQVSNL